MIRIFNQYVSLRSVLTMLVEAALIVLSLFCGARLRFWYTPLEFDVFVELPRFGFQALLFVITLQLCFYYADLYNSMRSASGRQAVRIVQSLGVSCLPLGLIYYLFPTLLIGRGVFYISMALVAASVTLNRMVFHAAWRVAVPAQRVLILGTKDLALIVARELTRRDDLNMRVVGLVRESGAWLPNDEWFGHRVVGSTDKLEELVAKHRVSRIIVALEDRRGRLPIEALVRIRVQGVRVEDINTTMSALSGRVWLETVKPSWFVFSDGFRRSTATLASKRIVDLICGLVGLILSAPIMIIVAVLIRLCGKGPIIFQQTRVGLHGKTFNLYKFRSMRVDAEANGAQWAQWNDPRITRLGKYLRKFRLDELPQFWNVIRGEMGFVGPRPERPEFVELLRNKISYYDERHSIRPGLTGWAQVSYNYGGSVEDAYRKLEYDLFYLKNMSFLFDGAILLKTVRIVLTGAGSSPLAIPKEPASSRSRSSPLAIPMEPEPVSSRSQSA
jgi:sugar transferase (PEP-CTERM system associated)